MNNLMQNVYTIFEKVLEDYNQQRAEKIELAYVGECQDFYVFSGDWRNLFLIDHKGGFEINLKNNEPKTVQDIEGSINMNYCSMAAKKFNYKKFIEWLYQRNTLVKNINWTNLQTINYIQKSTTKIKPFYGDEISENTGRICGITIGSFTIDFLVKTYNYVDKPHIIIKQNDEFYKFYIPDKKPKTQKEMVIVPNFPFKKEFFIDEIKDLKTDVMKYISEKSNNGKHLYYYELLLLYRAFNPDIAVELIKRKDDKITLNKLSSISFADFAVKKYAQQKGVNPYSILSEMYDFGFINDNGMINIDKKEEFVQKYSYLCE